MKKFTILFVGALLLTTVYFRFNSLYAPKSTATEQNQLREFNESKNREAELKAKNTPTMIQNQLEKVGKLTILEGQYKYFSKITDKGILDITLREMTLDFTYKFGLSASLENIKVVKVEGNTVILDVPKGKIGLQYIELSQDSKILDGQKMIFVSQFNPSEIATVINQSQQNVINKINTDGSLFDKAQVNLESELKGLLLKMGFENVVFNQI